MLDNSDFVTTSSPQNNNGVLEIGSYGGGTEEFFPGKIDDVRIYNYTLNAAQVKNLYNNDSAVYFTGEAP
jgi:hypothetical protein